MKKRKYIIEGGFMDEETMKYLEENKEFIKRLAKL